MADQVTPTNEGTINEFVNEVNETLVKPITDAVSDVVEQIRPVAEDVTETVTPANDAETPADNSDAADEVEEKPKRKSFFDIFKKKPAEEEVAPIPEEQAETSPPADSATEAAEVEAVAEADAVPVEEGCAKKTRFCGCMRKKCCSQASAPEAGEAEMPATESEVTAVEATEEATPAVTVESESPDSTTVEEVPVDEAPVDVAAAVVSAEDSGTDGEATTATAADQLDLARQGTLFKSGRFFKSHFNERHCRLLHCGTFQWSKTSDFAKVQELKLDAGSQLVSFLAEGEKDLHKFRFELHSKSGILIFACDSEEDRDEWVRAFETTKESLAPVTEVPAPVVEATQEEVTAAEPETVETSA